MSDTESFESVASSYDNYTWIGRDGVKRAIDRLKAAHDREIRDAAQKEYHRGFHDGQHSMDAEHRVIAMRLRGLRLDGDTHENLRRIAYAIYPCATGWTCESADGLRDKLIDLMGGVSDGTAEPMTTDEFIEYVEEDTRRLRGDATKAGDGDDTCDSQCHGACAAGGCGCAGKQKEVGHGGTADDSGGDTGGSYRGVSVHMDGLTAYDVLDNERRKAVCALRRWKPEKAINNDHCGEIQIRLLYQLLGLGGAMMMDGADAAKKVRDRLIHLLGGDKPSGIDVMYEMAECEAECRITDELRKWADGDVWSCRWEEFKVIADRIDEQFDRICQQQEAVLQETIDDVVKEYEHDRLPDQLRVEKLERQRDEARDERDELMKQRAEMTAELARRLKERDELQAKLDEYNRTHIELPRDKNGEVFRVDGGARVDDLVLTIRQMTLTKSGWKIRAYDENYEVEREASFFDACAPKPDLIEEIIEKLTLGEITQIEAIERIKSFHGTARRE